MQSCRRGDCSAPSSARPSYRPSCDTRTSLFEFGRAACRDRHVAHERAVAEFTHGSWKGRSVGQVEANARPAALLADVVQKQAFVLAYIDGFMVLGFSVIGVLLLMLLLRTPPAQPGPAAEQSLHLPMR